jgi:hypothetical protein
MWNLLERDPEKGLPPHLDSRSETNFLFEPDKRGSLCKRGPFCAEITLEQ